MRRIPRVGGRRGERLGAETGEWAGRGREGGIIFSFLSPFLFVISHCRALKVGRGARRPHRDGDLRRIRSGGETV